MVIVTLYSSSHSGYLVAVAGHCRTLFTRLIWLCALPAPAKAPPRVLRACSSPCGEGKDRAAADSPKRLLRDSAAQCDLRGPAESRPTDRSGGARAGAGRLPVFAHARSPGRRHRLRAPSRRHHISATGGAGCARRCQSRRRPGHLAAPAMNAAAAARQSIRNAPAAPKFTGRGCAALTLFRPHGQPFSSLTASQAAARFINRSSPRARRAIQACAALP